MSFICVIILVYDLERLCVKQGQTGKNIINKFSAFPLSILTNKFLLANLIVSLGMEIVLKCRQSHRIAVNINLS